MGISPPKLYETVTRTAMGHERLEFQQADPATDVRAKTLGNRAQEDAKVAAIYKDKVEASQQQVSRWRTSHDVDYKQAHR